MSLLERLFVSIVLKMNQCFKLVGRGLFLYFMLALLISCGKDEPTSVTNVDNPIGMEDGQPSNNDDDSTNLKKIQGEVILPEGSPYSLGNLTVQSFQSSSGITSGIYSLSMDSSEPNFLFLSNNEEIILAGYSLPGMEDYTINSESTLISMTMSLPIATILDNQGKIDLIDMVKSNSKFNDAIIALNNHIVDGKSPFDTEDSNFNDLFLELINDIIDNSERENSKTLKKNEPVRVVKSGNELLFQNPGKFYETVIGIYKDDVKIQNYELEALRPLAGSFSEALRIINNQATGNLDPKLIEEKFTMTDDGDYNIKIRTGGGNERSQEREDAMLNNLTNWTLTTVFTIISIKQGTPCYLDIISRLRSQISANISLIEANTATDILILAYDSAIAFLRTTAETIACFSSNPENLKFKNFLTKTLGWTKWVARAGNIGNLSASIGQWLLDDEAVDLCYEKRANEITACESFFSLIPVSDTNITATPNSIVPLQVRVLDANNNPVSDVEVLWDFLIKEETSQVSNILNTFSTSSISDSQGFATIDWEIGAWDCRDFFFYTYYAEAYLTGPNQNDSRVDFCSFTSNAILQIGCNNCGEGGFPVNGTVSLILGEYSYSWTISNNATLNSDSGQSSPIVFPESQSFDLTGSVTINLNRAANINVTICSPFGECRGLVQFEGFGTLIDGTSGPFDEQGNFLPISEKYDVRIFRN